VGVPGERRAGDRGEGAVLRRVLGGGLAVACRSNGSGSAHVNSGSRLYVVTESVFFFLQGTCPRE